MSEQTNIKKEIVQYTKTVKENALNSAKKTLLEELAPYLEEEATNNLFTEAKDKSEEESDNKDTDSEISSEDGSDKSNDKSSEENKGDDSEGSEDSVDLSDLGDGSEDNGDGDNDEDDVDSLSPEELSNTDFDENISVEDDEDPDDMSNEDDDEVNFDEDDFNNSGEDGDKQILNDHGDGDDDDTDITIDTDNDDELEEDCYIPEMKMESLVQKVLNKVTNKTSAKASNKSTNDSALLKENKELKEALTTILNTSKQADKDVKLVKEKSRLIKKLFEGVLHYTNNDTKKYIISEFDNNIQTIEEAKKLYTKIKHTSNNYISSLGKNTKKSNASLIKENLISKKAKDSVKDSLAKADKKPAKSEGKILQEQAVIDYWNRMGTGKSY